MNIRRILPNLRASLAICLTFLLPMVSAVADEPEAELARLFDESDLTRLSAEQKNWKVFRLTVLRSFHDPLQILIEGDDTYSQIIVKKVRRETKGAEYRYTRLTRDSRWKVPAEVVKTLNGLLEAAEFWKMPSKEERRMGLDGSSWTLEAVRDGKYHKVERDNPFLPVAMFEDIEKMGATGGYKPLTPGQAYGEGLLAAAFSYLWALSGEDAEELF